MTRIAKPEWQQAWMGKSQNFILPQLNTSKIRTPSGRLIEGWRWIEGQKIYIFRESRISRPAVNPVIDGLQLQIERMKLDITVVNYDDHESIQPATDYATDQNGFISLYEFGKFLVEEPYRDINQGGTPHADVLITDKPLSIGAHNWGASAFNVGAMIISLTGSRQRSIEFIKNLTMHETGHLLGYPWHHDTIQEENLEVAGYPEVNDCLMLWRASTREICPRCEDAIKHFWRGLEEKTGRKFSK